MLDKYKILDQPDLTDPYIDKIKHSQLPTILWGFGGRIPIAWDYLVEAGIEISKICDNDRKKHGLTWDGVKVASFTDIKQSYDDCNIIIVPPIPAIANDIRGQILRDGQFHRIYQFEMYYPYGQSAKNLIDQSFHEINRAYELLEDRLSKDLLEHLLCYAITKDRRYMDIDDKSGVEYFDETVLAISKDEIFCDCGVLDGGTTRKLKELKGYRMAYCFEPEPENIKRCRENFKLEGNIELIPAAVWDSSGQTVFASSLGGGSAINPKGTSIVPTIALDDYFRDKEISFLKMDIEGAELTALKGAENLLKTKHPKLAISAYHKVSDLWSIPLFIKGCLPAYKVFLRRYVDEAGYDSTICYACI